jgi:hypothetical protein
MRTEKHTRFHIKLNAGYTVRGSKTNSKDGFTTVSLTKLLSDLLAIKLGITPETKEARQAITKYLQGLLGDDLGRGSIGLSRYMTDQTILFISDKSLSDKYNKFEEEKFSSRNE